MVTSCYEFAKIIHQSELRTQVTHKPVVNELNLRVVLHSRSQTVLESIQPDTKATD
jgi:hypothetical protein